MEEITLKNVGKELQDNIKIKQRQNDMWNCKLDLTVQRPLAGPLGTVLYYLVHKMIESSQ